MQVKQLEEFVGQADQKGFWIFTYAHLAGAFIGAFTGNALLERAVPGIPALRLLGILAGVAAGVGLTWKVRGHAVYTWVSLAIMFMLRKHAGLGLGDCLISSAPYYRAGKLAQEPFLLVASRDGQHVPVLMHSGSGRRLYGALSAFQSAEATVMPGEPHASERPGASRAVTPSAAAAAGPRIDPGDASGWDL